MNLWTGKLNTRCFYTFASCCIITALTWLTSYGPHAQGSKSPFFDPPTLRSSNMTLLRYFEMSGTSCHIPEKQWSQVHRCESLQTRFTVILRLVWNGVTWEVLRDYMQQRTGQTYMTLGGWPEGRNHLEELGVDGIIKMDLQKVVLAQGGTVKGLLLMR